MNRVWLILIVCAVLLVLLQLKDHAHRKAKRQPITFDVKNLKIYRNGKLIAEAPVSKGHLHRYDWGKKQRANCGGRWSPCIVEDCTLVYAEHHCDAHSAR